MRTSTALVLALMLGCANAASGQEDFGRLKPKVRSNLRVTEDGLTLEGPLTSMSPETLTVGDHDLKPGAGLKIERDRGRTGWKGMAIGAAVGAALGVVAWHTSSGTVLMFPGAFWGGIIGVGMDRYVPVYDTTAFRTTASQLIVPEPSRDATMPIFASLHAKVGDRVFVTQDGVTVTGPISTLSPSRLVVGSHEFAADTDLKIEKPTTHTADGAVVGFFVGVLLGSCSGCNDGQNANPMASGIGTAVIGALIGHAIHGRTTLYDSNTRGTVARTASIAPVVDAHRRGVMLRLTGSR